MASLLGMKESTSLLYYVEFVYNMVAYVQCSILIWIHTTTILLSSTYACAPWEIQT